MPSLVAGVVAVDVRAGVVLAGGGGVVRPDVARSVIFALTGGPELDSDVWGTATPEWGDVWQACDATRCYAHRAYYTSSTVRYNHNTIWNVSGIYQLQSNGQWKTDVRCVILHEHGHTEGLSHSGTTAAVMYSDCAKGQQESLQTDDKDGLRAVYRSAL